MGQLSDHEWRRAVEFMLVAGEHGINCSYDGELPSIPDMAWKLHAEMSDVLEALNALTKWNIVHEKDGAWYVTHFSKWQAAETEAERKRHERERKQKNSYYQPVAKADEQSHEAVTKCDREIELKLNTEEEIDAEPTPAALEIPETPKEAGNNHQMQIFKAVTGRIPGMRDYRLVIETISLFQPRFEHDIGLIAYLKPYWLAWKSRTRQIDGKPYDLSNLGWLTDWAVNGSIPAKINGVNGKKREASEEY